uniref:NACHT domain-containing protein n=1 Tax=Amphimedon queenslandica TaxID=400682 RepID=A0A1X7TFQ9_AMPQE
DVELNPGPLTGNPKDIFRTHSDKLIHAISENLHNVTLALNAKGLITQQIKEDMLVLGASNYEKSSKLVNVIQEILEASLKSHQYLTELCQVLQNQQNHALRNIAASILGQTIPDDVLSYAHSMKQCYKAEDWMQALKDYSGRLTLVEKQDYTKEAESAGYLLMGQVDKVVKLSGNKEISVEDILRPVDDSLPLRVVINGPPGIGKTVLCHKLIKMWCETLVNQQYDLVLYCPLRNSKLATLADLFQDGTSKVQTVDWFSDRAGERLLIIFDGWDELSEQLRQSSLVASIIYKGLLRQCSVIVTSRSYASSSLLKINNLSRHVQVIGFSKVEISKVIIQTLQKDTTLAQEPVDKKREDDKEGRHFTTEQTSKDSQLAVNLIKDLSVQDDVQSLCYVPLLCSMVISVYSEEGGHLPTQLYEKFILQIIKRHVKSRHAPHTLGTGSLSSLPSHLDMPLQEMCQIAYTNLANTTMTFSSHQLQSLSEAVNEDYLGLMTSFIAHDEEKYQFLHLRIQEFLAAWWIAKHEEKTEEIAKNHFHDDHFRKCLSFVSEITETWLPGTFYFSEEIFKRTLNEADSLQYSVSTAIVQGEAGVEVSTSCIEAPCIAYISRYGSNDGKLWDFVTDDEIDENVIAQLQDSMIRAGQASNETDESFTSVDTKCSHYSVPDYHHSGHHQKVTKKQNLIIKPDVDSPIEENVDLHLSEPKMPIESETREDNDETLITAAVSRDKFMQH